MEHEIKGINNVDNFPFFSNTQTIAHQPDKVIIDFKNIHPQFTPDNKPVQVCVHRLVLMEPYVAKEFMKILKENIDKYEQKFGKIKKPAPMAKAAKEAKKQSKKQASQVVADRPHYMG
ncbi:DUF3467 domain-containing protein [Candidatus Woesearchaeota archaeon]|nr:DUF3467 domain-containing protein [Candidatus Woesearchaeota archaeon]